MTVGEALSSASIAQTDAELLLSHVLHQPRTWILAHADAVLKEEDAKTFIEFCKRRGNHEPFAHITGRKEFFGRVFTVNASTLIPRPATEILIEQTGLILRGEPCERIREADIGIVIYTDIFRHGVKPVMVVDVGTGSGCIAVTLACEHPSLNVIATDISTEALLVAQQNAAMHSVSDRVIFRKGDTLEPVMDLAEPFLLVSNPPYIPDGTALEKDVAVYEPHSALFAGPDGKAVIDKLITQAKAHSSCVGFVIECRTEQAL